VALDDIEAALFSSVPHKTCSVCFHLSVKPPEWGAKLRRMLANEAIGWADLANALANDPDEPSLSVKSLARHAHAECAARELLRPKVAGQ
jgi:hypothetical protein